MNIVSLALTAAMGVMPGRAWAQSAPAAVSCAFSPAASIDLSQNFSSNTVLKSPWKSFFNTETPNGAARAFIEGQSSALDEMQQALQMPFKGLHVIALESENPQAQQAAFSDYTAWENAVQAYLYSQYQQQMCQSQNSPPLDCQTCQSSFSRYINDKLRLMTAINKQRDTIFKSHLSPKDLQREINSLGQLKSDFEQTALSGGDLDSFLAGRANDQTHGAVAAQAQAEVPMTLTTIAPPSLALNAPVSTIVSPSLRQCLEEKLHCDSSYPQTAQCNSILSAPGERAAIIDAAITQAQEQKVNPLLVFAIMAQESSFAINARSSAGAYGLMQVENASQDTQSPVASVTHGVSVISSFWNTLDSFFKWGQQKVSDALQSMGFLNTQTIDNTNIGKALAAYNAGPGAVESHLGVPPYKETQNYVPEVAAHYNELLRAEQHYEQNPGATGLACPSL